MVRPTVEYCSSVWHPQSNSASDQLESLQHRAARWAKRDYSRHTSVSGLENQMGWRSLQFRRIDCRLAMLYQIVNGHVLIHQPSFFTMQRGGVLIQPIFCRTQYYQSSFFPYTIAIWNTLPRDVLSSTSVDAFKTKLVKVQY